MILITGAAGYIGSHVMKQLLENSLEVIAIDNLSTGSIENIKVLKNIKEFQFHNMDINDDKSLEKLFNLYSIDTIIHLAASIEVEESIKKPLEYYLNNTVNTTKLVTMAVKYKVKKFIFSSTAAVYGEIDSFVDNGISENSLTNPTNPYGKSKLMAEDIIKDTSSVSPELKYIIFRYFNVAGADINKQGNNLSPRIGQRYPNATHLMKVALECVFQKRDKLFIFGEDYTTKDGSCIRDFIHVDDIASAHIEAIKYLDNNESNIFNIGYGKGNSVKEVIETIKKVSGVDFKVDITNRRAGDIPIVISDNSKIKKKMNWTPKFDNLELICKSAYEWEKKINNE